MIDQPLNATSRRGFLKQTSSIAAASTLLGSTIPHVHAGEKNTINVALIGCGGRGTGAAANALSVQNGPIKLIAMADVFEDRLNDSYKHLTAQESEEDKKQSSDNNRFKCPEQIDVPEERRFIGFDAYKQAMDCLKPGDVAIFATPPAFRWVHFKYAIEKGLHVFMEKPVTVDGPGARKMLELADQSEQLGLKVGVGLMCRHCVARGELFDRIKGGEIGDIITLRAYRMVGPTGSAFAEPKPEGISELLYQIREFHAFLWASGGAYSDFLIHNIDECCWMKDAWPVNAIASGGRHYRDNYVDQNFDTYSVEYTFDDGTKLYLDGRNMDGCHQEFASYAHGSRGSAIISAAAHTPAKSRIFKGQNFVDDEIAWQFDGDEPNPYKLEWDHLIEAIRQDSPYNEVRRGVQASVVTAMGRLSAHTGQRVTYDEMLNHEHELAPQIANLTMDSDAPVQCDENGAYPTPLPGIIQDREYYSFSETSDETASPVEADVSGETEATDDS